MAVEYLSGWALSSWISPGAAFFLFVNLLIGAIVVTSRGQQGGRAASTRRLCRSASSMVLDRLRSFSIFSVHSVPVEESYHPSLELEAEEQQPQLAVAEPESAPVAAAAGAPADDDASEITKEEVEAGEDKAISSDEAHGRLASQGRRHRQQSPASRDVEEVVVENVQRAPVCRREAADQAPEGKAALNERAELFIRQFREDLKLQRLSSIINYTRALRRGAAAATPAAQ